jgi:hypothetical protein
MHDARQQQEEICHEPGMQIAQAVLQDGNDSTVTSNTSFQETPIPRGNGTEQDCRECFDRRWIPRNRDRRPRG